MTDTVTSVQDNSLEGMRHGFFGRTGGVSEGIYAGLNCGVGSNDDPAAVIENRRRVASVFGQDVGALCSVHQHHSPDCIVIDAPSDERPKADAMVTKNPEVILGILTADCQPVLLADKSTGVVGAAHAGWKGAKAGVLECTVSAMETLGARRENISGVIGPCISQANYEVGQEFLEAFLDDDPDSMRFFVNGQNGKYQFDLAGFGLASLRATGIASATWTGQCTYGEESRFYSYRRTTHRNEADYGRQIACIMAND